MKMKIKMTLLLTAAALLMGGCGKSAVSESTADTAAAEVTAADLLDGIEDEKLDGIIMSGDEQFDKNAGKFFSVESADILDGGILYNTEGGYADEISAIKFADGIDGQKILKDRLESRTSTFRDYRPEELDKLEKAKVLKIGGFDVLIISDRADEFEKALGKKL